MVGLRVTRKTFLQGKSVNSMSNTNGAYSTYLETHQAVAQKLSAAGTDWLDRHRNDALNQFGIMGLPTGRDEQWKYTNVRPIARKMFTPSYVDPRNLDSVLGEVMTLPEIVSSWSNHYNSWKNFLNKGNGLIIKNKRNKY